MHFDIAEDIDDYLGISDETVEDTEVAEVDTTTTVATVEPTTSG